MGRTAIALLLLTGHLSGVVMAATTTPCHHGSQHNCCHPGAVEVGPVGMRRTTEVLCHRLEWGTVGQCPTGFTDHCCVNSLVHDELWDQNLQEGIGCRKVGEAPFTKSERWQMDHEAAQWMERGGSVLNVEPEKPASFVHVDPPVAVAVAGPLHHQADDPLAVVQQRVDRMLWKPARAWSRRTGRVLSKDAAAAGAALRGGGQHGAPRPLVDTNPLRLRVPEK
ncbi:MAG: hypothetical protein M1826_001395 [Phylliscum demangeonii]|nr:MAG: hypothetical protein M1826_001395 [Phylliscum demangeonii]